MASFAPQNPAAPGPSAGPMSSAAGNASLKRKLEADLSSSSANPGGEMPQPPSIPGAASGSTAQPVKKQRPPMPPPYMLAKLVPESEMFADLLRMEQKLDWTMLRKKSEVEDALGRPVRISRTLRVYLSNTAFNQPWQVEAAREAGEEVPDVDVDTGAGVPAWQLRIEGRLLDTNNARIDKTLKRPFSSLIKSLTVEFDHREPQNFPGGNIVEVLPPLCDLIGVKEESRAQVMSATWKWIKTIGAQDRDEPTKLLPKNGLEKLLPPNAQAPMQISRLPEIVNAYLTHPDPVVLNYKVEVDQDRTVHPVVFDIPVYIEDPLKTKMHAAVQALEGPQMKEIREAEDEVARLAHTIRDSKHKRDFMQNFAEDPQGFIHRWLANQARDLDLILGNHIGTIGTNGGGVREEDLRRSDLFRLPWIEEAVTLHEGARMERLQVMLRQQQGQQQQHGGTPGPRGAGPVAALRSQQGR